MLLILSGLKFILSNILKKKIGPIIIIIIIKHKIKLIIIIIIMKTKN